VIQVRYKKASRIEKTLIRNEFVEVCGYHRKYATSIFSAKRRFKGDKKGPHRKYGEYGIDLPSIPRSRMPPDIIPKNIFMIFAAGSKIK